MSLAGRHIVVGVGGGIAAYKTVHLVRELGRRGAQVRVAMTRSATRFVGPITFAGVTGQPVATDLMDEGYPGEVHVELAAFADAIVIAPATANLLARAAAGMADDVLLATLLCCDAPVLFAPAMHGRMWRRPSTARNVARLVADGAYTVGPARGPLANGEVDEGRMAEPEEIADALEALLATPRDLEGRHVVVSAGPTLEDLDPVRFLGNRSSGRMGYALAGAALARGARVTLVSGPVALAAPAGAQLVPVRSALEMRDAVRAGAASADAVIMAAAVADYRPAAPSVQKIEKRDGPMQLALVRNPDILAELGAARRGRRPVLVGFALETEDVVGRARAKLDRKGCDLVVANHASVALGGEDSEITLVSREASEPVAPASKVQLADRILDRVATMLAAAPPVTDA